MKKLYFVTAIMVVGIAFLMSNTYIYSQQKIQQSNSNKIADASKLQLFFKTDLRVDVIHSSRCPNCDLPGIDAFYMANILVDVSNYKASGVGAPTESILTVSYFDLMQGKLVTVTKNLPKMHPYPTNPWTLQRYMVVNHPVLIKKSKGITATIKPKSNTIKDPIAANDMKIVKKCMVMVY